MKKDNSTMNKIKQSKRKKKKKKKRWVLPAAK